MTSRISDIGLLLTPGMKTKSLHEVPKLLYYIKYALNVSVLNLKNKSETVMVVLHAKQEVQVATLRLDQWEKTNPFGHCVSTQYTCSNESMEPTF